ncbi:MAG: PilZ domain-containing protein [Deltaproteobacteria bacterium]|nr:PilZ domain-containing protein [Deltaproteobacteria bacterium]
MKQPVQQSDDAAVRARLAELISNMSDVQRQDLLSTLEDWPRRLQRKHPRKDCHMAVDYTAGDRTFKDFIRNLSAGGAFIETRTPFSIGQEMTLTFSHANNSKPIKITGEIVWTGTLGIGVKFKTPNQDLELLIKSLY